MLLWHWQQNWGGHQGHMPPLEEILPHSAPPSPLEAVWLLWQTVALLPPMYSSQASGIWVTNMASEAI